MTPDAFLGNILIDVVDNEGKDLYSYSVGRRDLQSILLLGECCWWKIKDDCKDYVAGKPLF